MSYVGILLKVPTRTIQGRKRQRELIYIIFLLIIEFIRIVCRKFLQERLRNEML